MKCGPLLVVSQRMSVSDLLAFVFDGGTLHDDQVAGLRLADGELTGFEFCTPVQAERQLNPRTWRRLVAALTAAESGQARYLVDGHDTPR